MKARPTLCGAAVLAYVVVRCASGVENAPVLLDMVQNNPGDQAMNFQASAYQDPTTLARLNFTGQVSTGENSIALTADFGSLGVNIWPENSPERAWVSAYAAELRRFTEAAIDAGIRPYFFTDLMVFPNALLDLYKDQVLDADGKIDFGSNVTKQLMRVMFDQMFSAYPETAGIVVRTGETYVYDNPYHRGNSPLVCI